MNLIKINRMPSILNTVDGLIDGLFNNYPYNLKCYLLSVSKKVYLKIVQI